MLLARHAARAGQVHLRPQHDVDAGTFGRWLPPTLPEVSGAVR